MPRPVRRSVAVLAAFLAATAVLPMRAAEAPPYQTDFAPEEFRARWTKVFDAIGEKSVALVAGAPLTNGFLLPRQTNDFYYLCGVETPGSYLLLDGRSRKATIFLPPRNARLEASEGRVLSATDAELARKRTGADSVESTEAMGGDWLTRPEGRLPETIYTPFAPAEGAEQSRSELQASNAAISADPWDGRIPREARLVGLLRTRYPRAAVRDLSPVLDGLRSVKSPPEIALIRQASRLAGFALLEAMRSTRPGVFEYQLDASARYVFLAGGARLEAYRSIVASGTENIWNPHYFRNSSELKAGDLVLLDYAPDFRYYVSDVARMWPVSGRYSPSQRELLGFVLAYRNAVLERIRPGVTAKQILEEVRRAMEPVLRTTKFSKPAYEQGARKLVETGGGVFSHPVGMAVHDDGAYEEVPLRPGHVFSIDPQLRVPEENLYLRYEDVVVVTVSGVENFTAFLPSALDDIEKAIKGEGLLQKFPPPHPEK